MEWLGHVMDDDDEAEAAGEGEAAAGPSYGHGVAGPVDVQNPDLETHEDIPLDSDGEVLEDDEGASAPEATAAAASAPQFASIEFPAGPGQSPSRTAQTLLDDVGTLYAQRCLDLQAAKRRAEAVEDAEIKHGTISLIRTHATGAVVFVYWTHAQALGKNVLRITSRDPFLPPLTPGNPGALFKPKTKGLCARFRGDTALFFL